MSDSVRPSRWQPARLPRPWDSPGKNTGVKRRLDSIEATQGAPRYQCRASGGERPKYLPTPVYIQKHVSEGQSNGAPRQQGINMRHLGLMPGPAEQLTTCVSLNSRGFHRRLQGTLCPSLRKHTCWSGCAQGVSSCCPQESAEQKAP